MALHDLSTFEQLLIDLESLLHATKENIVVHYIYGVLQWDTIFAALEQTYHWSVSITFSNCSVQNKYVPRYAALRYSYTNKTK
jgi:hypothetical protein